MAHPCLGVGPLCWAPEVAMHHHARKALAQEEPPEARHSRKARMEHRTRPHGPENPAAENPAAEALAQGEPPEAPTREALAKEEPPDVAGKALAQEELLEAAAAEWGLE